MHVRIFSITCRSRWSYHRLRYIITHLVALHIASMNLSELLSNFKVEGARNQTSFMRKCSARRDNRYILVLASTALNLRVLWQRSSNEGISKPLKVRYLIMEIFFADGRCLGWDCYVCYCYWYMFAKTVNCPTEIGLFQQNLLRFVSWMTYPRLADQYWNQFTLCRSKENKKVKSQIQVTLVDILATNFQL